MPETRSEWLIFVLGLAAVAGLVVVAVRARHHPASTPVSAAVSTTTAAKPAPPRPTVTFAPTTTRPVHVAKPPTARTATAATTAATTTPTTTAVTTTVSSTAAATTTTAPPVKIDLTLRAARGDSWVEVRAGSSTAAVLYTGTLAYGASRTFSGPAPLWVRFGVAGNVDAVVNGRSSTMPAGTYSVLFDSSGYQHVTG
jgi:cytoskeletal protein RodZ